MHGTRTRFNQGCTDGLDGTACDPCTQANRDYFKGYTQQRKANVTQLPTGDTAGEIPELGPVEASVVAVLAGIAGAEKRPDLAASARAMARIQDNMLYVAQWTNAAKQQREIMAELLKGSEKKSRLAAVRQLTTPGAATG